MWTSGGISMKDLFQDDVTTRTLPAPICNETYSFLSRGVAFLRYWPVEKLRGDSRACTVYYFDRNQVLVRDSNNSDWIYVVLKGSLSVIKKLKRVEPQSELTTPRLRPIVSFREPKQGCLKRARKNGHKSRFNPGTFQPNQSFQEMSNANTSHEEFLVSKSLDGVFKTPFELESRLEQTLPGYRNAQDRLGCIDYDKVIESYRERCTFRPSSATGSKKNGPVFNNKDQISSNDDNKSIGTLDQHSSFDLSYSSIQNESTIVPDNDSRKSSLILPDISQNNKVVKDMQPPLSSQHGSVTHNGTSRKDSTKTDTNTLTSDGESADDEMESSVLSDNQHDEAESHRRRRKRRHISKTSKGVYLAPSTAASKHRRRSPAAKMAENGNQNLDDGVSSSDIVTSPEPPDNENRPLLETARTSTPMQKTPKEETVSEKLAKLQIQYQRRVIDREGRKTISEELDQKARREYRFTEADLDPTIIEVQVLERGQYFGLSPLLFPDQASLAVVSNGAECLVLSKKLFLQWASEKCLRNLRQTENPYPSDGELRTKLQEVINWQAKRAVIYKDVATKIKEKKDKRKQYLCSFQGEYCFRTGPV